MKLKNYQEDLVLHVADIVLRDRPDIEPSEGLLHDVAAYVLNRLPPRYIMSERGFTRLAAEHWVEGQDGEGLSDLVQVLLLVNRAVDVIRDRRMPSPGRAARPAAEVQTLDYWHNLPYLIGRVMDAETHQPVVGASVTLYVDGVLAEPADSGWLNPYLTNPGTRGFYSFLPQPVRSRSRRKTFLVGLLFRHEGHQEARLEREVTTEGEFAVRQYIESEHILNLDTTLLQPS